jgi:hypothetical protein
VADETVALSRAVDLELARAAQRHRQVEQLVADVGADVDRRRQRVVFGHPERRPVGKHAGRTPQPELADAQEIPLDLDLGEAPAVADERLAPRLDVALEMAILLLKVLWLEEQPLGPDNLVIDRHSRPSEMQ